MVGLHVGRRRGPAGTRTGRGTRAEPGGTVGVGHELPKASRLLLPVLRWNKPVATTEMEETWAQDLEDQKRWEKAVEAMMPPVVSWEQQRWHIYVAPGPSEDGKDTEDTDV